MGVFQEVSNWLSGSYKVRTTKLSDNAQLQHVRIDLGSGTSEDVASGGLPIVSGLSIPEHDYIAVTYPVATQEVYTFKTGGSGGTTVATVTINYTDATKENLSNVART